MMPWTEIFLGTCVRIIDWDSVLERMSLVLCLDNVEVMWRKIETSLLEMPGSLCEVMVANLLWYIDSQEGIVTTRLGTFDCGHIDSSSN